MFLTIRPTQAVLQGHGCVPLRPMQILGEPMDSTLTYSMQVIGEPLPTGVPNGHRSQEHATTTPYFMTLSLMDLQQSRALQV
jgi:hypothetical protein